MNPEHRPLAFGQTLALLAVFLGLSSFAGMFVMGFASLARGGGQISMLALGVGNALAMAGTVALGTLICQRPWRQLLSFGPMPWRLVPAVLLVCAGAFLVCSEIENVTRMAIPMPHAVAEIFSRLFDVPSGPLGAFVTMALVAPLSEEPICRGWILRSLLASRPPARAIGWSALIFGLMHLNPWQFFYATALGLVFGWIYWRTRSVWLTILCHALNNGTSWLLSMTFDALPEIPGLTQGGYDDKPRFQPLWLDATGLAALALGLFIFWRQTPLAPGEPPAAEPPLLPPLLPPPLAG